MTCRAKYGTVHASNAATWPRDFLTAKILAKFDWVTANGFMLYVMFYVQSVIDLEIDPVDRSSECEVESVDNIVSKSTFGSGADSAEHGEQ